MALKEVNPAFMQAWTFGVELKEHVSITQFVGLMSRIFAEYPALLPERFDPFDPLRTRYTEASFQDLVNNEDAERHLMWRGKKMSHSLHRMADEDKDKHKGDTWIFDYDRKAIPDETVFAAAAITVEVPLVIATLHTVSVPEMEYCKSIGFGLERKDGYRFSCFFENIRIFGLPTLAWRTYFGPMYIRHFGKERLLSAPAWSVKEMHPDVISLQLTELVDSIGTEWERFHDVRQRVIAHLGAESFQRPRTSPNDPPPRYENDRMGVPGTSVPAELVPLRQKAEAEFEMMRRPKPPAVESLEEMLAEPTRFRVFQMKAGKKKDKVIVDTLRKEMIGFADSTMRQEWIDKLLAAGAEFKDLS